MNLFTSFQSEILKTKRTASFYLTIITAALIPLIFLLDASFDGVSAENRKDTFNALMREGFTMLSVLIFPMFVILICTLLPQIEYRNTTWKQVLASPQPLSNVFIAKFLNVQVLILLFLFSYNVFMGLTAVAIHFIDPTLHLLNQPLNGKVLLLNNVNGYIAILAISAIQFWIGLRFKNFIINIAIGFAMWVIAAMLVMQFHTEKAHLFPYTYGIISFFPKYKTLVPTVQWYSIGYMAFFLGVGFFDFRKRRMRG